MALGALISACADVRGGGGDLYATLPLAGRTLLEYQARLASAADAAPIVVLVERIPPTLLAAVDRLLADGIAVQLARTVAEAAAFFAPDDKVLLIADGLFADAASVDRIAGAAEPVVMTIPDNIGLDAFERIDGASRWAGLAVATGRQLAETTAMLGEWDLQSTLLRRLVQSGARQLAAEPGPGAPLLLMASRPSDLDDAERRIVAGARGSRGDWVERYVTPLFEEFAVERLMRTTVRPQWLVAAALLLTVLAAFFFAAGWRGAGLAALLVSVPLDGIGERLAALRMQPLSRGDRLHRYLPFFAGVALTAFGVDLASREGGWGSLVTTAAALAFFHAGGVEKRRAATRAPAWLASRKGGIVLALPFALAGLWTGGLVAVAAYAAASFLRAQQKGAAKGD
ncbi:MAG: hypothetical protein AVDCRST_MAG91-3472 [uncultured Sphingomonadaceae bacterium]|uniref:Uncharacterized protein n=1 Tax=uncultured Sphingomonadaceae bacterium TaxID=169976 RepID=A0A6J4U0I6_9SPHN|nr:MAG: hypothetical protein AVDCRST_MAG91-3472 [uncultured Sphingomonadaceae bacterium]